MKSKFFLLFLLSCCIAQNIAAQKNSIALSYDDVTVGRNINLLYRRALNDKWTVYGGLKYHLNSQHFKNDFTIYAPFFKEFEAQNIRQRFGLKAGIERSIYSPNSKVVFFAFGDLQLTRANVYSENIIWFLDTLERYGYGNDLITSLESALGLGVRLNINPQLAFHLQGGFGFNYYWSTTKYPFPFIDIYFGGNRRLPLPASRMISAGFNYNLISRSVKKVSMETIKPNKHFLNFAYNNVQVGRNYSLTYHRQIIPNLHLYGGVKLHLNSKAFVDYTRMQESYYFKQFRAANFAQHWGAKAGLEYAYNLPGNNLALFAFYDLQITKAEIRNLIHLSNYESGVPRSVAISIQRYTEAYPEFISYRLCKPATAIENTMGIGARMGLSEKINFRIQAGLGLNYYIRPDTYEPYSILYGKYYNYSNVKFDAPKTELSKMFSMGFEYRL